MSSDKEMIRVRPSQIYLYKDTPLYYIPEHDKDIVLYKEPGISLTPERVRNSWIPTLYILKKDRLNAVIEIQNAFNKKLKNVIEIEDISTIKSVVLAIVDDFFTEPSNELIPGIKECIETLLTRFTPIIHDLSEPLANLAYTTAVHSVNVMCITLGYSIYYNTPADSKEAVSIALAALFHDIGKNCIDEQVLNKAGKLSEKEFEIIQKHPLEGYKALKSIGIDDPIVLEACLNHHENSLGTGYPNKIKDLSEFSILIGLVDKYEALTSSERLYKEQITVYETLNILKRELLYTERDKTIFNNFVSYMAFHYS